MAIGSLPAMVRVLVFSGAAAAVTVHPQVREREPVPVSAPLPLTSFGIFGQIAHSDVTVRTTVQDGVVSEAATGAASPNGLAPLVENWIKSWRFRPGVSATFDVVYRHLLRDSDHPCTGVQDIRTVIRAELPRFVQVESPTISTCDPMMLTTRLRAPVKTFTAVVVCECPANKPIAGLEWVIKRTGQDKPEGRVTTDKDGRFTIRHLEPGAYLIDIEGDDYYHHAYEISVAKGGVDQAVEIRMTPEEHATYLPVPTRVDGGDFPAYPDEALANGIEGTVKLRVSVANHQLVRVSASEAPAILSQAALANARTWRFGAAKAAFTIEYRYRLRTGDCTKDLTTVTMQLPTEVQIVGVRGCRSR